MEAQTLTAEVRGTRGKGPARQLRMRGLIPAIIYGPDVESTALTIDPAAVRRLLTGAYGRNQLIEVTWAGNKELAIVRDVEVHPVSQELLHVDLYQVAKDRAVEARVPFEVVGRAVGVQKGGVLRKLFRDLPVRAFPQNVPASIVLDVGPLDLGATITVKDLPLPEEVEVTYPPQRRVLFIESKERGGDKAADDEEAAEAS
ncbi:MAG: 50S ribosomal protein L25 [Sandaracinaceae bacterium]